jgi:hypothetical protein
MLGEINLSQWQCAAELIDNSVDAFLAVKRAGQSLVDPEVALSIPTTDDPQARVMVRDNGPGMSLETLENAVKAGWTSNGPTDNLGMFGMGFNIATARLGTVTRVWTVRESDAEWCGLEIDFDALVRQRHYRTKMLTRPKAYRDEHGTEISIERLKPEQRTWFARAASKTKLSRELGRVYSSMLRANGAPVGFRLTLNGTTVPGRLHCVWGGDGDPPREASTGRFGVVQAYQIIDRRLADRLFCVACWQWLSARDESCPACNSVANVSKRTRRVHGWLGIQRYLSERDYGIDFLRHGRKIETANKDLFNWNTDGSQEEEYPIDDPRHRGRIVGEMHLDHCRVTYMKDRFDRNDPAWEEMMEIVRGKGPLRPDKASELGYGQNTAPLFLLFQAFRRSSPKPKVAGCYAKLLIVPDNDEATTMAQKFYSGEQEFQSDGKWWDLVVEADRALLLDPTGDRQKHPDPLPGFGGVLEDPAASTIDSANQSGQSPLAPLRTPLLALTKEYRDDVSGQRWDVHAFAVEDDDPVLLNPVAPWALKTNASGVSEYLVDTKHEVFDSATLTPLDALLAELAWQVMDFHRGQATVRFAPVLAGLRDKYGGAMRLDTVELAAEAGLTLNAIAKGVAKGIGREESSTLFAEMGQSEQEGVLQRMAARGASPSAVGDGRFLEFAPRVSVWRFFERHPELFFDGKLWEVQYSNLDYGNARATEEARNQLVRYYSGLIGDAVWLAENEPTDLAMGSRDRLLRAALSLQILGNSLKGEDSG